MSESGSASPGYFVRAISASMEEISSAWTRMPLDQCAPCRHGIDTMGGRRTSSVAIPFQNTVLPQYVDIRRRDGVFRYHSQHFGQRSGGEGFGIERPPIFQAHGRCTRCTAHAAPASRLRKIPPARRGGEDVDTAAHAINDRDRRREDILPPSRGSRPRNGRLAPNGIHTACVR